MSSFHPELRRGRWLPRGFGSPFKTWLERHAPTAGMKPPAGYSLVERRVGMDGPRVLVFSPPRGPVARGAMLWIHGGGYVMGSPERDFACFRQYAEQLDLVVVAVDYRLAPEHPYPAPLDDCFAAFEFVHREATSLGIDPTRVVIAGASAGGGLAAALTLLVHDRGRPAPRMQLLIYPMLDDRSITAQHERDFHRLWDRKSNFYGWSSYLGAAPGGADVPAYAAPARRRDLAGLPATWIGVGELDLFYDEDVLYARRLQQAGVPTQLELVEGAFHGFDIVLPRKSVSTRFLDSQLRALRQALTDTA
ncbi:MAG: alpha/beta hydrolase [Polyangiales bacterium]